MAVHATADIGSIVKAEREGQEQYFHYGWRGDVTALTDGAEQAIQTYTYDAFGNVIDSSGTATNPYQFSSKPYDSNSGLSYFGRRHYTASLGRFITQDPKEYIDGLNTYAYVKNNPVNLIDLLGTSIDDKKPTCRWQLEAWIQINMYCRCYWNCIPDEGIWWDGNLATVDAVNWGIMQHTGGNIESGDSCLCPYPSETDYDYGKQ